MRPMWSMAVRHQQMGSAAMRWCERLTLSGCACEQVMQMFDKAEAEYAELSDKKRIVETDKAKIEKVCTCLLMPTAAKKCPCLQFLSQCRQVCWLSALRWFKGFVLLGNQLKQIPQQWAKVVALPVCSAACAALSPVALHAWAAAGDSRA